MGTALSCAVISCDSLIEAGVHSQVLSLSSPPAHLSLFFLREPHVESISLKFI